MFSPGTTFANDFRIVERIGAGGMGTVYVAEQISTGRRRALKTMLPTIVESPELRKRFEQEARIGSRIESEHVVEVVAAGIDDATGTPWLAMELLVGEDLGHVVDDRGPMHLPEIIPILEQLCHALGAAHAAGIVHRDLKPENVFLAETKRANQSRIVKVLDFGIAKLVAEATTRHTAAVGSPSWMAPEQSERGAVTPAADVWSIGLLAFTLFTGKSFWLSAQTEGATIQQVMRETIFERIPSASERAGLLGVAHLLPPWFDAWFSRCMHRDPVGRLQNATAAWNELQRLLAPNPVAPTMPPIMRLEDATAPTDPLAPPVRRFETQTAVESSVRAPRTSPVAIVLIILGALSLAGVGVALILVGARTSPSPAAAEAPSETPESITTPPDEKTDPLPAPSSTTAQRKARRPDSPNANPSALVPVASDPFDRSAAVTALSQVDISDCKDRVGPTGAGHVQVMFDTSGRATAVTVGAPFAGTPTGECIARKYKAVKIPAFQGSPVSVGKSFTLR